MPVNFDDYMNNMRWAYGDVANPSNFMSIGLTYDKPNIPAKNNSKKKTNKVTGWQQKETKSKYVGGIKKIYHNPKKATTVVISHPSYVNSKVKVKRDAEDPDDIYMAVASALMIRKCGSNSAVKAYIRKILPRGFEGRPQTYQIIVSAEIGDMFGSWEKFCKVVDEKLEVSHGRERKKTESK